MYKRWKLGLSFCYFMLSIIILLTTSGCFGKAQSTEPSINNSSENLELNSSAGSTKQGSNPLSIHPVYDEKNRIQQPIDNKGGTLQTTDSNDIHYPLSVTKMKRMDH